MSSMSHDCLRAAAQVPLERPAPSLSCWCCPCTGRGIVSLVRWGWRYAVQLTRPSSGHAPARFARLRMAAHVQRLDLSSEHLYEVARALTRPSLHTSVLSQGILPRRRNLRCLRQALRQVQETAAISSHFVLRREAENIILFQGEHSDEIEKLYARTRIWNWGANQRHTKRCLQRIVAPARRGLPAKASHGHSVLATAKNGRLCRSLLALPHPADLERLSSVVTPAILPSARLYQLIQSDKGFRHYFRSFWLPTFDIRP